MADVKWIKIVTDIFDNRKIKQIERLPEADSIIVIWFKLLCLAGDINENGLIIITKDIPYTDEMLANEFNKPITIVRLALDVFQQFGMIEIINNIYCVSNWEKYQNIDSLEKIREQTRKRVAEHRKKQKLLALQDSNVTCNVTVTQSNATDKEKEIDIYSPSDDEQNLKSKEKQLAEDFEKIWNIYPRKEGKSKAFKNYTSWLKGRKVLNKTVKLTNKQIWFAVKRYAEESKEKEKTFIKMGSTFFADALLDYVEEENE